jgi:hypothetical protein
MTAQLQSYASCQLRASRPLALCAPLPPPVHFCTPVLLTTHRGTWFASGYRRRSRRLPVVVDVLHTTIFITILLARPFGEVVLQLLFLHRAATASGRGVVVATVFPTAASSRRPLPDPPPPPPASYHCPRQSACCLGAVCAQHLCAAAAARQVRSVLYYSLPLFGVPHELAEGRGGAQHLCAGSPYLSHLLRYLYCPSCLPLGLPYSWIPYNSGIRQSGLTPSILHYNWVL